jgi:hypothetical protein
VSNDLTNKQATHPAASTVAQTGGANVNVNNQPGATVNFNYYPKNVVSGSAEELMAIQSFSSQYYQLLVTCEEDVFKDNLVTVSADRALGQSYVAPEILEHCSSLSDEGIAELKTFPAIICQENTEMNGTTDPKQFAVYAYITMVKVERKNIKVAFHPIRPFSQQLMCIKKNAIYFDLDMDCAITDLNHSAWSVHKVNLFKAFDVAGLKNMPRPD